MEHAEDQFLAAGGVTVFTQTWMPDEGEAPRALVVLSHGFGEHSGRYAHVAQALVDAGYGVAALDHRGHGRSGGPRALFRDLGELTADFAMFRRRLAEGPGSEATRGLPQVLLGHSMGGAIVLDHLVGDHPDVAAVVLSGPYLRNAAAVPAVLRRAAPIIGRVLPWAPTQRLDAGDVSRDAAVVAAYEADPLVFHGPIPAGTGASLLGIEARIMRQVDRITEPVLIVHGTDDRLADVAGSQALARTIGSEDVELKTYAGLHHEVFNEPEQDQVIGDVIGWLDSRT